MRTTVFAIFLMLGLTASSQTVVTGKVVDQNGAPIPNANVVITGKAIGTVADFDGNFRLETSQAPPFELTVSSIGYSSDTASVTTNNQNFNIQLTESTNALDEIVISASRTPERIFESPVSVERFGIKQIKNTSSADFYGGLENLKGVDVNTNSLTFKSVNTRGFATFANTRFVQLVDGMDNSSPALNFVIGNLLGMSEIDVNSVELLPGASSALYGANAFNGILFMTSKSPFDYPGISAYAKTGITSQEAAGDNEFYDFGIRAAHKFSEKFAAKANFTYLKGTDWNAVSQADVVTPGGTRADFDYDGLNIYGDEVSTNIRAAAGGIGIVPDVVVSRTGYAEEDLTNYNAESVKADFALHYRPWATDFEIIYNGRIGTGSTIYQGANRYNVKNFFLQQHKLEFKNDNFFVRGYITDEDAGDSYDMRFTGININRAWKDDTTWFGDYIGTYVAQTLGGALPADAHTAARAVADTGRLIPGTPEFQAAFDKVIRDPDVATGSQFKDATQLRHVDANYNFTHLMPDIAEIQVGGSFREYKLNSFGTIFTDGDGPITYSEFGVYMQVQKKLLEDRLKITASARYDKSQLFDGNTSPRLSVGYSLNRNHNIRASFQRGFRNPTTQDLFIGLNAGRAILVGSAEENLDRDQRTFNVTDVAANGGSATATIAARQAYENSYTAASVLAGAPEVADVNLVESEKVSAYEVGYRGKINRFIIDISGYWNFYSDFISNRNVVVPYYGTPGDGGLSLLALANDDFKVYQTYTNTSQDIESRGFTAGVDTKVFDDFDLGINYTFADFEFDRSQDPDFLPAFNTPQHKVKASFGNTDLFKNFGFNVSWRWSDSYTWEATFGSGPVPAYHVADAQINLRLPKLLSTVKAGATNIGGDEYFTAFGTGFIGSQYYISWTVGNF